MNAHDAIRTTLETSSLVLSSYCQDLSDDELLTRPGKGCNHLKWQLGHLIASECGLLESICPGEAPELPAGFAEAHGKEAAGVDDPSKFLSKQEYFDLFDKVHAASLAALAKRSEADLDQPGPEHFRDMFPTVGHIFVLIATHGMMHAGQVVPIRRALGKPIIM
jgi:uncharacterized damage-inducible protein DinB